MEKLINNSMETNTSREMTPERKIIKYRWLVVLIMMPLFYAASNFSVKVEEFFIFLIGLSIYNFIVTLFMLRVYPKTRKIPDYIYYIDTIVISLMSLIFGGLNSDVYVIYLFIIASYCASNKISTTLRFTCVVIGLYSFVTVVHGLIYGIGWIGGENLMRLLIRDISFLIITYGVGLLIKEVRVAGSMHKMEFERARTDKLTGLPNRHYMEARLKDEIEDCKAHGKVLNVLMFDIDNFKKFNDTYGHLWGDELLKRFASIIQQSIRKSDIPIRYGGEEFIVLVKDIDFITAKNVANRVRRQLEMEKIIIDNGIEQKRVTVSCGVAQYPSHSDDIKEVIEMADKALYGAKENGKNIVITYDELIEFESLDKESSDKTEIINEVENESHVVYSAKGSTIKE
jgi:diguanylate cyclase (GGDEF)-like protein